MGEQLADDVLDVVRLVDDVVVVEDQDRATDGDRRQLRHERLEHGLAARAGDAGLGQQGRRPRRELGVVLAARGDEVVQERDPVPVVVVEPVPEGPHPAAPREIGQQRRLAVARVGQEHRDPAVDLHPQPVEQARTLQRLVPQRGSLHLLELDGVAVDLVAQR